jgi:hypothetical protein
MMIRSIAMVVTLLLMFAGTAAAATPEPGGDEAKSLKERLSDKASDEQRVNNCRVPLDRRGTKPRPGCAGEAAPGQTATAPSTASAPQAQ